jgi:hypothetical protein
MAMSIKKNEGYNSYTLTVNGVTIGKVLNILHSLDACAEAGSELAGENAQALRTALMEIGIEVSE